VYVELKSLFKKLENKSLGSQGNDFDSYQDNQSLIGSYKEEYKEHQGYNYLSSYPKLRDKNSTESEHVRDSRKQSSFTEVHPTYEKYSLLQSNLQSGTAVYDRTLMNNLFTTS